MFGERRQAQSRSARSRFAWVARAAALAGCLAGALGFGTAHADDGYVQLGLGGVVNFSRTEQVRMEREVLDVSPERVRVALTFVNTTGRELTLPVLFPLPRYSARRPSFAWAGEPQDFQIHANGQPLGYRTLVKALDCSRAHGQRACRDVTRVLRSAGLTNTQIAFYPMDSPFREAPGFIAPARLSPEQVRTLLRRGLLLNKDAPGDELPYPVWEVELSYLWLMHFPARRPLEVVHEYRPFASGGSIGYVSDESVLREEFCADDATVAAWRALPSHGVYVSAGTHAMPGTVVDYILTSANTWQGPIRDFTLRLHKTDPAELVALCFPATPEPLDSRTLTVQLRDFTPQRELHILFMNAPEQDVLVAPPDEPPHVHR
jgi:hypothetical protein